MIYIALCCAFIFVIIFVFLNLVTSKYVNPYLFHFYVGKKGAGKTTILKKIAYLKTKEGKRVFCTEQGIANTYYLPYDMIGNYWFPNDGNTVLLIDEIGMIWGSRSFMDKKYNVDFKKVKDWFVYQRHNRVEVYACSQQADVDKQLRGLFDTLSIISKVARVFVMEKQVGRRIVLSSPGSDDGNGSTSNYLSEELFYISAAKGGVKFHFIPKWTHLGTSSFSKLDLPDLDVAKLKFFPQKQTKPPQNRGLRGRRLLRALSFLRFTKRLKVFDKKTEHNTY